MRTPLTIKTFVDRAEHNYPDRVAIVDEPDQPADAWPDLTFGDIARKGREFAAGMDQLGIGFGERIAVVSHNAARLQHQPFNAGSLSWVSVPLACPGAGWA